MTFASLSEIALTAPIAFGFGFVVGLILASRYVILLPRWGRRRGDSDGSGGPA